MLENAGYYESGENARWPHDSARDWSLSRRSLLGAGALLGLAAITLPAERAFAWSSWTNATSELLKDLGMGDCVHEDLVQISYARMLRNHVNDKKASLLNPWAGTILGDGESATIAGDIVNAGEGKPFTGPEDLAARLFRENLAYLRIGSFWNDAAANTLFDFGLSCVYADSVPKFSGNDYYEGAWDVGQHLWETNEQNKDALVFDLDALVQFTMNDRNNFIHGMLSSTASHSGHLKQSDVKLYALQWLGVAYEYARTGKVMATNDVTQEQAEKIFKGFIDTYGQLDNDAHDMCVSLQVGWEEATIKLPHRRLRLRALGMMCHTMEDFWCPAHTCRTYHSGGDIPVNSILSFSNYKLQNGNKLPLFGYHIPFDRYAVSDSKNHVNWREALTRGDGTYAGTDTLANVLDAGMSCLDDAHTYFNTLGMNETIACITKLFEYMHQGTAWDDGVRAWIDADVLPTYFNESGQSYICSAGRRSLHTPTYVISQINSMKRAYRNAGLTDNYNDMLAAAKSYDDWQRGAHLFYSGKYNTSQSKYITQGYEGDSIWADSEGESRLVDLVNKIYEGYTTLGPDAQKTLLLRVGCNGCHDMVSAIGMISGMLQEFSIDLRGCLRADDEDTMVKLKAARSFFESGLNEKDAKSLQASSVPWLLAADVAYADEGDEGYISSNMAVEDFDELEDGSYLFAVRDMDSLETSVMTVPVGTPGIEKLEENLANLAIAYELVTEFEDDPDYCYSVIDIDYSDMEEDVFFVTGTVSSVAADKKSLVLDLNGTSELMLTIRDGMSDIPDVGDYICARHSSVRSGFELVGYDELDAPGELMKVTYPVAMVAGSSMWLVTNSGETDDGYLDYMEIEYGSADVFSVPREGYYATVYYHDEAYGDTTDVDERALAAAPMAVSSVRMSTQSADDELNDSPTPGYLELGDEYGALNYGNEVFHIANIIAGSSQKADDAPPSKGSDTPSDEGGGESPVTPTPSPATSDSAGTKPSSSKPSSSTSAKTNDPVAGFGVLLSAAAVAGAAMTAYSARRVANERKDPKED